MTMRAFIKALFQGAWISLVLLPLALTAGTVSQSPIGDDLVDQAQVAYEKRDYARAYKLYSRAAEVGSAVAMFQLGSMNEHGHGVKADIASAARWYQKAADAGSATGAKRLANMYFDGPGWPPQTPPPVAGSNSPT
jgi:hypothetical protein